MLAPLNGSKRYTSSGRDEKKSLSKGLYLFCGKFVEDKGKVMELHILVEN
jgi:hypothetical protein